MGGFPLPCPECLGLDTDLATRVRRIVRHGFPDG
jgi:hypothetical protein